MLKTRSDLSTQGDTETIAFPTTEGHRRFPDFIQDSYGRKTITGFDQYGRFLGAIVPPEAVFLLAEEDGEIDEFAKHKIRECARKLIRELHAREEDAEGRISPDELRAERAQLCSPN